MIPVSSPHANYLAHKEEIDGAIHAVLDGGQYICGEFVEKFEEEFAAYIGVKYAIGVASGTDAIEMILRALTIGSGDEVITVSQTATGTVAPIALVGAKPVFAPVHGHAMTMNLSNSSDLFSEKTKAILPVHLYGRACRGIDALRTVADYMGIYLIEDACQAHGAMFNGKKVGSFGIAAAFSFYPTKNLGCLGDGGAITTDNEILAKQLRAMRFYDWDGEKNAQSVCGQSRLDAIQAAVLSVKLKYLDRENARRREIAWTYERELRGLGHIAQLPDKYNEQHTFHQFVIRDHYAAKLRAHLKEHGIITGVHYPTPVHKQHAYYQWVNLGRGCETSQLMSLPMYPEISDAEVEHVIEAVMSFEVSQ